VSGLHQQRPGTGERDGPLAMDPAKHRAVVEVAPHLATLPTIGRHASLITHTLVMKTLDTMFMELT
jgi:hypothetical protein